MATHAQHYEVRRRCGKRRARRVQRQGKEASRGFLKLCCWNPDPFLIENSATGVCHLRSRTGSKEIGFWLFAFESAKDYDGFEQGDQLPGCDSPNVQSF